MHQNESATENETQRRLAAQAREPGFAEVMDAARAALRAAREKFIADGTFPDVTRMTLAERKAAADANVKRVIEQGGPTSWDILEMIELNRAGLK